VQTYVVVSATASLVYELYLVHHLAGPGAPGPGYTAGVAAFHATMIAAVVQPAWPANVTFWRWLTLLTFLVAVPALAALDAKPVPSLLTWFAVLTLIGPLVLAVHEHSALAVYTFVATYIAVCRSGKSTEGIAPIGSVVSGLSLAVAIAVKTLFSRAGRPAAARSTSSGDRARGAGRTLLVLRVAATAVGVVLASVHVVLPATAAASSACVRCATRPHDAKTGGCHKTPRSRRTSRRSKPRCSKKYRPTFVVRSSLIMKDGPRCGTTSWAPNIRPCPSKSCATSTLRCRPPK
jgi:hypothetical protein